MSASEFAGKSVVLTRHVDNNAALAAELSRLGATVIELPLISFQAPADNGDALVTAVASIGSSDWLAVLSPEGARRAISILGVPPAAQVAVVGDGTAQVFRDAGWAVVMVASESSAFGLAADLVAGFEPTLVVIAQSDIGRPDLSDALRKAGWAATTAVAYQNVEPTDLPTDVAPAISTADAVVFASPSAVERFTRICNSPPPRAVCFGRTTATAASSAGFKTVVSRQPSVDGVIAALSEALA